MALQLDDNTAIELAGELTLVPHFPKQPEAIAAAARWLLKTCRGDNEYTPYDQAQRVVEIAVEEFPDWKGIPALKEIYVRLFITPKDMTYNPPWLRTDPPTAVCERCEDNALYLDRGDYRVCECGLATEQTFEIVRSLNARRQKKPMVKVSTLVALIEPKVALTLITEQDVRRAEEELRKKKEQERSGGPAATG